MRQNISLSALATATTLVFACAGHPDAEAQSSDETGLATSSTWAPTETTDTPTEATITTHSTEDTTGDCILGSKGCTCVDGLCLGDLECLNDLCEPPVEHCDKVLQGNVNIMNSAQLDQLIGVRQVAGSVAIAAELGDVPQLACLEEAASLSLGMGNDYSAMQSLKTASTIYLNGGPGTSFPKLAGLMEVEFLSLQDVGEVLSIPNVQSLSILILSSSAAPDFGDQAVALDLLRVVADQGDYATLSGALVERLEVQEFTGTALPPVVVDTLLNILIAPNLTTLGLILSDPFPAIGPNSLEEEGNSGIQIQQSGLKSLDDLAGISTFTTRIAIANNAALVDISALIGAKVALNYALPPDFASFNISSSPLLCMSHAQSVADTMDVPTFVALYFLDEKC